MPYVEAQSLRQTLELPGQDWDIAVRALPSLGLEGVAYPSSDIFRLGHTLLAAEIEHGITDVGRLAELQAMSTQDARELRAETFGRYDASTGDEAYAHAVASGNMLGVVGDQAAPGITYMSLQAIGRPPLWEHRRTNTKKRLTEVLNLMAQGMAGKRTARGLNLSKRAVDGRVQQTKELIGGRNLPGSILVAHTLGILPGKATVWERKPETDDFPIYNRRLALGLLATLGFTGEEIAARTGLSLNSVIRYRSLLVDRLDAVSWAGLPTALIQRGNIVIKPPIAGAADLVRTVVD